MVPSELMGLNSSKFKQLNNLIKNKKFMNNLILNVESILYFSKKKSLNFFDHEKLKKTPQKVAYLSRNSVVSEIFYYSTDSQEGRFQFPKYDL